MQADLEFEADQHLFSRRSCMSPSGARTLEVRLCNAMLLTSGTLSDLCIRLRGHAQTIAKETLFTEVASLDIIQALSMSVS